MKTHTVRTEMVTLTMWVNTFSAFTTRFWVNTAVFTSWILVAGLSGHESRSLETLPAAGALGRAQQKDHTEEGWCFVWHSVTASLRLFCTKQKGACDLDLMQKMAHMMNSKTLAASSRRVSVHFKRHGPELFVENCTDNAAQKLFPRYFILLCSTSKERIKGISTVACLSLYCIIGNQFIPEQWKTHPKWFT